MKDSSIKDELKTFEVIAKQRDWNCEIIAKDVVLFNKN